MKSCCYNAHLHNFFGKMCACFKFLLTHQKISLSLNYNTFLSVKPQMLSVVFAISLVNETEPSLYQHVVSSDSNTQIQITQRDSPLLRICPMSNHHKTPTHSLPAVYKYKNTIKFHDQVLSLLLHLSLHRLSFCVSLWCLCLSCEAGQQVQI